MGSRRRLGRNGGFKFSSTLFQMNVKNRPTSISSCGSKVQERAVILRSDFGTQHSAPPLNELLSRILLMTCLVNPAIKNQFKLKETLHLNPLLSVISPTCIPT